MVQVTVKAQQYHLDGYLKSDMDFVKKAVLDKDNLFICLVDGRPGTGKSTLIAQLAYYINPNFSLKDMTFSMDEFEQRLRCAVPGDCVVFDEGYEFNRKRSLSIANIKLIGVLQRIRVKRIFIFIILPFIYDLEKNIVLGLAEMFIHCWRKPFGPRGQFSAYDRFGAIALWKDCRNDYIYPLRIAQPIYRGRFVKFFPLDYGQYENKKISSMDEQAKAEEKSTATKHSQEKRNIVLNLKKKGMSTVEIAEVIGMKKSMVYNYLKEAQPENIVEAEYKVQDDKNEFV